MPKHKTARPIADCLDADASMARLSAHAKRLLNLQRCLNSACPATLAAYCRVANFKLGIVIIHADNGAVATKLRQLAARLEDEFHKSAVEVTEIRIKVQPRPEQPAYRPSSNSNTISAKAKWGLTSLSNSLPEDSPLGLALRRMVNRAREG